MSGSGPSLRRMLAGKRLVVFVGEGGVGKTTAAAACAYALAHHGGNVGVLTVDPAPRLGDALGVPAIDSAPRRVALGAGARGSLVAMRLDVKGTFDRMVEDYAPNPEAASTLIRHPVYRAIAGGLGGSEHYMAFQRLYELVEEGRRDTLVLDTPPAVNAAELLAAPARLTGLVDTGALGILAEPARIVARAGGLILRASFRVLLAALERAVGGSLQRDVAEFAELFGEVVGGLEERARGIDALLRAPDTAFVLVVRPRSADIERALAFRASLQAMHIELEAIVVNRLTPPPPEDRMRPAAERLGDAPKGARATIRTMEKEMDALRAMENRALDLLASRLDEDAPPVVRLYSRDTDVGSLEDIAALDP